MPHIELKPIKKKDLQLIWSAGYAKECPEWVKFNAPYFEEYEDYKRYSDFLSTSVAEFLTEDRVQGIFVDGEIVGMVSWYWECKKTRWLEVGIIIYEENFWNQGIASQALRLWIDRLFNAFPQIQHVGMTTWSGNPAMMRVAEKIGMVQEACIRKVRYWQDHYYDSVKYGVIRDEWKN